MELMKELLEEYFCNQHSQMGLLVRRDMTSRRWELRRGTRCVGKMMIVSLEIF